MKAVIFSCKIDSEYGSFDFADSAVDFCSKGVSDIKWAILPPLEGGDETLVIVAKGANGFEHTFAREGADVFWKWICDVLSKTHKKGCEDVSDVFLCHHRGGGMPCDIHKKSYQESGLCDEYLKSKGVESPKVHVCDVSRYNQLPKFLFNSERKLVITNDVCVRLKEEIDEIAKIYNAQNQWRSNLREQIDEISGDSADAKSPILILVVGRKDFAECKMLYEVLVKKFGECTLASVVYLSDQGVVWKDMPDCLETEVVRRVRDVFCKNPIVVALAPPSDEELDLDWLFWPWHETFGEVCVQRLEKGVDLEQFVHDVEKGEIFGGKIEEGRIRESAEKNYYEVMKGLRHGD